MKQSLPKDFLENLKKIYSPSDIKILKSGFSCVKRNITIRVNPLKSSNEEIEKYLKDNFIKFEKVSFLPNGYILFDIEEKDLWDKDIFLSGKIYLQSLSSQIPVNLLDINSEDRILDLAASPWWKTSQAAAILNNTWEIVALDNNQIRIDKLNFTLKRQWVKNVNVIKKDSRKLIDENPEYIWYFDKIIADVPCSAEGKFCETKEKSFWFWNENIVKKNAKLQKEIMKSVIPLLKNWWEIVYSTCTLSPLENEDIVHMLLCNFPELELIDININFEYLRDWILKYDNKCFKKEIIKSKRILPSEISEGFFIAKFKKNWQREYKKILWTE